MNPSLRKVLLPLAVLGVSGALAWYLLQHPTVPTEQPVAITLPRVRVQAVAPQSVSLSVHSQGVVSPRVEIDLVTQVAGSVTAVHTALSDSGFFKNGEVLVQLDPRDYDTALVETEAQVAEARKAWHREAAEAEQAKIDWQALGQGQPSPYVLHQPQRDAAKAQLAAAEARLKQARLNRERTALRAPFDGRVRESKGLAVGQYVATGTSLGRLYAIDKVRVRLPLKDSDLAYVDLPLGFRDAGANTADPPITLYAEFAGQRVRWPARIVSLEGAIDERTRLVHVLAEVKDPFDGGPDPRRPPLTIDQFVEAEIAGRSFDDVFVLPPVALHGDDRVLVIDRDARLHFRPIRLLRQARDRLLIQDGLTAGERVVVSPLEEAVEGMRVAVETAP